MLIEPVQTVGGWRGRGEGEEVRSVRYPGTRGISRVHLCAISCVFGLLLPLPAIMGNIWNILLGRMMMIDRREGGKSKFLGISSRCLREAGKKNFLE